MNNHIADDDLDVLIEMSLETYDSFPLIIKKIREELQWIEMPIAIRLAVEGLKRNNSHEADKLLIKHKRI